MTPSSLPSPPPPSTFILEELIQYYNLMQFLSNQSKLTPNQKNCWYYVIDTKISLSLSECMSLVLTIFVIFWIFYLYLLQKSLSFLLEVKVKKKNWQK